MRHQADVEMNNGSDGECLSLIDDWFGSFEQELRDEGAAESWLRKARAELEQPASEGCAAAREAEKQAFRLLRDRRDGSSKHMAAVASILLALRARRCDEPREAMRAIDLAICVGGPDEPLVRLAQAIEGEVLEGQENNPPRDLHLPEREEEGDGDDEARENCSLGLVERVESMGRADFKARFYDTDTPVVLEGEALHWRAMEEWTSLNKLYRWDVCCLLRFFGRPSGSSCQSPDGCITGELHTGMFQSNWGAMIVGRRDLSPWVSSWRSGFLPMGEASLPIWLNTLCSHRYHHVTMNCQKLFTCY